MKLWANYPSSVPIDKIVEVDPTKGFWWTYPEPGFRYREVLPILWDKLNTRHFLWCTGWQGAYFRTPDQSDLVEWELDVALSSVLAFYDEAVWENIVRSKSNDWTALFVNEVYDPLPKHVGAFISVPLPPGTARCLGPTPSIKIYDSKGSLQEF